MTIGKTHPTLFLRVFQGSVFGNIFKYFFRLWNHTNDLDERCRSILSSAWSRNKNNCCSAGDCYKIIWWANFIQSWRRSRWLTSVTHSNNPWLISMTHFMFRISMILMVVVPHFQRNNLIKQLKNWVAQVHPYQPQPKICSNKLPVIFNPTTRPNMESQPLPNLDSKKVRYFSS